MYIPKSQPDINIEGILKKHEDARARLKELEKSDENSRQKYQVELDRLFDDIDNDLRKAMAYLV